MTDRPRTLFPNQPGDFVLRDAEGTELMRFPWMQQPPPPQPKQPGITVSALKRGSLNTASDFSSTAALIAEAVGSDEYAESFRAKATEFATRAEVYRPTVGRFEEIEGPGDLAVFAFEKLVENAPMLASLAVPGGLFAKGAQLAGAGAKAASAVGASAAFLSNVGLQTGESATIAREEGVTPVDSRVIGSGIGKAALDFVPILGVARRLGLAKNLPIAGKIERIIFGELSERGFIRRAARASAGIVALEVPTETAQEVLNIALQRTLSEFEGDLTDDEKSQLINAAAGAAAFGLLGIPGGVRRPQAAPDPEDTTDTSGGTPTGVDLQIDETQEILPQITIDQELGPTTFDLVGQVVIEEEAPTATIGEGIPPIQVTDPKLPRLEEIASEPVQVDAAKLSLLEEPFNVDNAFYVDMTGKMSSLVSTDPLSNVEPGTDEISQGLQLTKEQLEIASMFPQYVDVGVGSPEGRSLAALHPGLQNLYETRSDLIDDADNYRSTDGQLKVAAEKRLANIDARIDRLQGRLGVPPLESIAKPATPDNVQEEVPVVDALPPKLTDNQAARLELLDKKERLEGLSIVETDEFVKLQGIATGEIAPIERVKQTAQDVTDLQSLATVVREDETTKNEKLSFVGETQNRTPGTGIGLKDAQRLLTKFAKHFKFGPQVRLLTRDHPEVIDRRNRYKKEIQGWFDPANPGIINIVPGNTFSNKELQALYLHETVAHYGLATFLTTDEQIDLLRSILKDPPPGFNIDAIRAAALENGQPSPLWVEAEEYIAKVAETAIVDPNNGIIKMPWWKRLMAIVKRFLRKHTNVTWSDNDILLILRDNSKLLTGRITPRNLTAEAPFFKNEMFSVLDPLTANEANQSIGGVLKVWGARFDKMFLTPLQFAKKHDVPGTTEFLDFVQQWWARKRTLTADSAALMETFKSFGRRDQIKMAETVMKVSIESDAKRRKLTQEELNDVFKETGIENDTALIKMWEGMDKSFQDVVVQLRKGLETIAIRTQGNPQGTKRSRDESRSLQKLYARAQVGTAADKKAAMDAVGISTWLRLQEIDKEMLELENRNYFPRMRFGNWAVTIRAVKDMVHEGKPVKGPTGDSRGEVVYFETFESIGAQKEAFDDLAKSFPRSTFEMQAGKIAENEFHFMGVISPQLYENLLDGIPKMNAAQKEALRDMYLKQAPGRSFLRHLTKRKGVDGYSEDVLRVYASYMMNVANHISRVEFHIDLNEQLGVIRENAAITTPDARVAGIVSDYFTDQYNYIMNPKNDLAHLRAMGFLWYLGFNVKSAVVNLTQVPMVAYPFLASKYGDAQSSAAILKALALVTRSKTGGQVLSPEIREQLERAVREGFVDESRATEMAALAEQSTLQRLIPENRSGRLLANSSFYGAFLFQKAERFNREVVFVAAYNLAKANGVTSKEEAFRLGREAVQTTMFEYAKWNRPEFMRGKKSVFFLFWQYMQGMAFMGFGGAGQGAAMRLWMMLLLAGGLQGLPFAENILDLLDFVGTQTKQRLGMKDPRVDLRNDLRELANEITDRPDMIMHGLSRYYGLGPFHMLGMLELPVPNVDISGSISVGRILPGTEDIFGAERDASAKLGRTMIDAFGPVAAIPYNFLRVAMDNNPDRWKVWERAMPSAMKGMSTALRRQVEGAEKFRGGGVAAQFDPGDPVHRAENIAQFLGFATTRVNQRFEADFSIENMKRYWAIRRALVMENVAYARMGGDREVIKDAGDAMRRFNETVPDRALAINVTQLQRSLKQRFRKASLRERGIPSELLYRRIVLSMRELFPETEVEIESSFPR